jgi:hypothetical protein
MELSELQAITPRTPDHDELMARIDRGMTQRDYIEVLNQVALAYKELTDAMAAAASARRDAIINPLAVFVALFRWLVLGKPSPWSISRFSGDRFCTTQSRLSQAEQQLGSLVAYRLPTPCTLFDGSSPQYVCRH